MQANKTNQSNAGAMFFNCVPFGEKVVSMVEHKGEIFVATEQHVYRLLDGVFKKLMFESTMPTVPFKDHK